MNWATVPGAFRAAEQRAIQANTWCRRCRARSDEPCRQPTGRKAPDAHVTRFLDWVDAGSPGGPPSPPMIHPVTS